jgi:hypothetical protein
LRACTINASTPAATTVSVKADSATSGSWWSMPIRSLHGGDAVADQRGLRHQARPEASLLHALRRAADVEVDLVIAEVGADPRAAGERRRIAAAKLKGHRMLCRIEADQPVAVAMQHGAGRHHFGVDQRPPRQQPMEEPAMPVGPFHHRRHAKPPPRGFAGVLRFINHLAHVPFSLIWSHGVRFGPIFPPVVQHSVRLREMLYRRQRGHDNWTDSERRLKILLGPDRH